MDERAELQELEQKARGLGRKVMDWLEALIDGKAFIDVQRDADGPQSSRTRIRLGRDA